MIFLFDSVTTYPGINYVDFSAVAAFGIMGTLSLATIISLLTSAPGGNARENGPTVG
ncbi:hypothetical protein F4815DRAFT_470603 [Daldinia loculata]|nr:hypothetical protein F4815DRAFT_470603 [Daldinia loculata]